MTHYLVLGATRIQQWIARTTPLFLVRGASTALTKRTANDSGLARKLSQLPGLRISCEVADVAGIIVLHSDQPICEEIATKALDMAAGELPGIEWSAWMAEADTYIEAYRGTGGGKKTPWQRRRPPALTKIPPLSVCDGCHDETAVEPITRAGEVMCLGPDCLIRHKHAFPDRDEATSSEQSRRPTEFVDLAALGLDEDQRKATRRIETAGRGRRDNHLATIAADGNRIGAFFERVAQCGDQKLHAQVSQALDESTCSACADACAAAAQYVPYAAVKPGIVHYVGGDDVLASVAAQVAWPWALTLGHSFKEHFTKRISAITQEAGHLTEAAEHVSLGIGMVFSHATYPFALTTQMATRAENQAKRAVQGSRSAIVWADLTAESSIPEDRYIDVEDAWPELNGNTFWPTKLGRAARQVLAGLLRPHPEHGSGEKADQQILTEVTAWAQRTKHDGLRTLCEENRTPSQILTIIRNDLDRSRWWPLGQEGQQS